jgi:menaquinol-cytochrome c reductase iron-sulfur subunit
MADDQPHLPPPSLWPVGFAIGVAVLLVGLVINPRIIAPIGALIAIVFGFLWVRDVTSGVRRPVHVEPEVREVASEPAPPAVQGEPGMPLVVEDEAELERFPRNKFLEGATLGVGGLIGGLVTVPAVGFAIWPTFNHQHTHHIDLGALDDFPEGKYVIATFMLDPKEGEVTRRTAYVRNNGLAGTVPSFTILSNRCAHLGCPVQPNGPIFDQQKKIAKSTNQDVTLIPSQPAGFGCPCHGGQYDTEGNRVAGPPVRALDRYEFSIREGHLWIGRTYSVGKVDGSGASAKIHKYNLTGPGQHVNDWEQILYPFQPPHS